MSLAVSGSSLSLRDNQQMAISSGDEYTPTGDSEEVWEYISEWRQFQVITLKIKCINSSIKDIIGTIDIQIVTLPEDTERILLPNIHIRSGPINVVLNKIQRKFYNRAVQFYDFADEPFVDSVAKDLLDYTDYEGTKLHFRSKPKMKMTWKSHDVSSESDYGVYSDRSRGQNPPEYLLLVKDKCPSSGGVFQSERQLSGEMLLAAYNRSGLCMKDQEVFGIIIKGDRIRFYRCTFSEKYLRNIANDEWPQEDAKIFRYPPDNEEPLSISHPRQRETIVRILCVIREHLEAIVT